MATPIIPAEKQGSLRESYKILVADADRKKRAREMADEYRGSLRKFVAAAWPQVEPSKTLVPCWHIDAIADHVQAAYEGQIPNLLITVPPGSAKSTIVSVTAPAWMWTRNPGFRSTFLAYDDALSTRDSVACRNLMESIWYQETFQPTWRFSSTQNEKTYYVNSEKGFRVSGKGTGWRSHVLTYDDPLNAKDRFSDLILNKVIDDWDNVLFNRFVEMSKAIRIIIMQRLTDRDLAGHVLRKGGFEHLKIAMEYDPSRSRVTSIGWKDPRQSGEIMCPALFPPAVIENLKTKPEAWASQYQQEPNVDGGGILKSHKWNYWQPPGANLGPVRVKMPNREIEEREAVTIPAEFDTVLMSWDCSFKDLKTSDFVCGQVHAVRGPRRFILKQVMRRMGIVDTMAAIRELSADWPDAHLKLVEDKANGTAVVEMLQKEMPGLVLVNPEGGKVSRAQAVAPEQEAGNWYLPHPRIAPWVGNPENPTESGFIASSVVFPFGANDDDIDSFTQGARRIQKLQIGGEFGVSEKDIRTDAIEIPEKWPRLFGVSINWRELGAVWITRAPDTNQHYLYASFVAGGNDPAKYAAEMKKQGDWIPGVMHAAAPGRDEKSGHALISTYQKLGLHLEGVPDDVAAELADMAKALRAGELKILSNVPSVFDQFRMFHRDDKGKLPDVNCGTIMAMCVAWRSRSRMRAKPEPLKPRQTNYSAGGPQNSWMGS